MKRFWLPSKEHLGEFRSLQSAMVEAETSNWQPGRQRGSERFPRCLFLVSAAAAAFTIFGLGFWCGQAFTSSGRPPIAQRSTQAPNEMALRQARKQQAMTGKPVNVRPTAVTKPTMRPTTMGATTKPTIKPATQPGRSVAPPRRSLLVQPD